MGLIFEEFIHYLTYPYPLDFHY